MPLRFDATLKDLVPQYLPDYEQALELSDRAPLVPLNVDLSIISAATDIVLGQGDPPVRVVDLNFQSGPDPFVDERVLMYGGILRYRYHVPVHSVLVLLRPAADHPNLTGRLRYEGKKRKSKMDFTYEIVRLWRQPRKRFLTGGLGTLPLAPLCRLPEGVPVAEALAPIIRQIDERLTREAAPAVRAQLLTATYVLTGLRVDQAETDQLFQGIQKMKDSSTYQAILAEGRSEGRTEGRTEALQQMLLRLGKKRFGPASKTVQGAIQGITDLRRLERLTERILDVASWQELLAAP